MKEKIYERKTIGGTWFEIYVTENKNENILEVVDRLNNKKITYENLTDGYVLKIIRIMNYNKYASGHEMAKLINKECRNLKIDLSWENWVVEL